MTIDITDDERERMTFSDLFWATFDPSSIVRERSVLEIGRRLIASVVSFDAEEWEHSASALAVIRFREEWDSSRAVAEAASNTLFMWKHT